MFDLNKIFSLSPDEIIITNEIQPLAEESKRISQLIHDSYVFRIGENQIKVWEDKDGYNAEYLTHDGIWQARYLHQTYDVLCTPEEIYKLLVADYLVENGYVDRFDRSNIDINEKSVIFRYFRKFVILTEDKNKPLSSMVIE